MKPTNKELKEFWEWCGLYKDLATDGERHWFMGEEIVSPVDDNFDPILDLNNLFKYAVPKLAFKLFVLTEWIECLYRVDRVDPNLLYESDPATALYRAIKEEIDGR